MADDLGVGDLGAYGGRKIKTLSLDRNVPNPDWPVVAKPAGNNAGKKQQQEKAVKPTARRIGEE